MAPAVVAGSSGRVQAGSWSRAVAIGRTEEGVQGSRRIGPMGNCSGVGRLACAAEGRRLRHWAAGWHGRRPLIRAVTGLPWLALHKKEEDERHWNNGGEIAHDEGHRGRESRGKW